MRSLLPIILVALILSPSLAWWENGHMLVAQVAKLDLLENHPEVYPYAEDIALVLAPFSFGLSTSFIESAVWADDIKGTMWDFWNGWHFQNYPYDPEGLFVPADDEENSVWAINTTYSVLTNSSSYGNITIEKSMMMRMMMHIMGDMHQPLHNAERFSSEFPTGDLGGNLVNVTLWDGEATELHAFWDSIAEELPSFNRPLNQSSLEFFENYGLDLMAEWPRTSLATELNITDVEAWSNQIYLDAVQYAYNLLPGDSVLTTEYQETTYAVCRRNIALGGYRLSDMIYNALANQLPNSTVIQA